MKKIFFLSVLLALLLLAATASARTLHEGTINASQLKTGDLIRGGTQIINDLEAGNYNKRLRVGYNNGNYTTYDYSDRITINNLSTLIGPNPNLYDIEMYNPYGHPDNQENYVSLLLLTKHSNHSDGCICTYCGNIQHTLVYRRPDIGICKVYLDLHQACTVCGKLFASEAIGQPFVETTEEKLLRSSHFNTAHPAKAPTCTEDGNPLYYKCGACSKNFSDAKGLYETTDVVIEKLNHKNAKFNSAVTATCTTAGSLAHYSCPDCGGFFEDEACTQPLDSVSIPADSDSHANVVDNSSLAKLPTCTEDGMLAHWACNDCHLAFADAALTQPLSSVVIPATDHAWPDTWTYDALAHWKICENDADHTDALQDH